MKNFYFWDEDNRLRSSDTIYEYAIFPDADIEGVGDSMGSKDNSFDILGSYKKKDGIGRWEKEGFSSMRSALSWLYENVNIINSFDHKLYDKTRSDSKEKHEIIMQEDMKEETLPNGVKLSDPYSRYKNDVWYFGMKLIDGSIVLFDHIRSVSGGYVTINAIETPDCYISHMPWKDKVMELPCDRTTVDIREENILAIFEIANT